MVTRRAIPRNVATSLLVLFATLLLAVLGLWTRSMWSRRGGLWWCGITELIVMFLLVNGWMRVPRYHRWMLMFLSYGVILNIIVVLANGGRMPYAPYPRMTASHDHIHIPITADTLLPRLSDRFIGFSIGDFYMDLGVVTIAAY
jgi:hypothetical protein